MFNREIYVRRHPVAHVVWKEGMILQCVRVSNRTYVEEYLIQTRFRYI